MTDKTGTTFQIDFGDIGLLALIILIFAFGGPSSCSHKTLVRTCQGQLSAHVYRDTSGKLFYRHLMDEQPIDVSANLDQVCPK